MVHGLNIAFLMPTVCCKPYSCLNLLNFDPHGPNINIRPRQILPTVLMRKVAFWNMQLLYKIKSKNCASDFFSWHKNYSWVSLVAIKIKFCAWNWWCRGFTKQGNVYNVRKLTAICFWWANWKVNRICRAEGVCFC